MHTYRLVLTILLLAMVIATGCGTATDPVSPVAGESENDMGKLGKSASAAVRGNGYSITGHCILDINNNGYLDQGEPGINGIDVWLDDNLVYLSDRYGWFVFRDLEVDDYVVFVDVPEGYEATSPTQTNIPVVDQNESVMFMLAINEKYYGELEADTWGLGYWKNNIRRAIGRGNNGRGNGNGNGNGGEGQVNQETLEMYLEHIADFALSPFTIYALEDDYDILDTNGRDAIANLSRHLLCAEFNFMAGAWLANNEMLTALFLHEGEYMILHPDEFTRAEILEMKDLYEAYNEGGSNHESDEENDRYRGAN